MCVCVLAYTLSNLIILRGKQSFDQAGLGADKPAEVKKADSEYELYRKRMMLAYRFRPNPLVRVVLWHCKLFIIIIIPHRITQEDHTTDSNVCNQC